MKRTKTQLNKKIELVQTIIRPLTLDDMTAAHGGNAAQQKCVRPTTCTSIYTR